MEFSHHSAISDLTWLVGVEISSRGKLTKMGDGAKDCNFLATIGGDGKVGREGGRREEGGGGAVVVDCLVHLKAVVKCVACGMWLVACSMWHVPPRPLF